MSGIVKSHKVIFSPLRMLFLSLIPQEERELLFPNANQKFTRELVTTSVFTKAFWPSLNANMRASLSSDRAWFGIRSLMNGGLLGERVDLFNATHFRQLGDSGGLQIPRSQSREYFSSGELTDLIQIQNRYQQWKRRNNRYDELDIVKEAMRHYAGMERTTGGVALLTAQQKIAMIRAISAGVDQFVQFGPDAQKFIKDRERDGGFSTRLFNWIQRLKKKEVRFTPVGRTGYGHTVLKSKVSQEYRAFCSIVRIKDVNSGKPHVYIHTICHTTDQNDVVNRCCDTLIEGTETTYDELDAENSPDYTALGAYAPVKPLPSVPEAEIEKFALKITGPNNLNLDDAQKEALASNQPLLIDGLAGTGKTAVLAIRASLQLTYAEPGRNVLVCASMGHVVEKLRNAIEQLTFEGRRNDSIKMDSYGMGISAKGFGKSLKLDEFISTKPSDGFDEIILDECQDLTYTEFQLLLRLTKGKQARRFSIAGDPMQTLNPTGFDWGTIRAMFIQEMKNEFSEGKLREIVKESKFHRNYRSQSHLVELNNAIQRHRSRVTGVNGIIMKAGRPPLRHKPFLVCIDNHDDKELLHNILKASGKAENKAIIITWSTDDHDLERLLEVDEDLSPIWIEFKGEDYSSEKGVRSKFLIHSASSIKGDEHDAVILYKFLSNPDAREKLSSMLLPYDELTRAVDEERIAVAYAFSRLYVSLTRAFSHVVVVEDKEGYEFWKNTKLTILDGNKNLIQGQMFQDTSSLQAAVNALQDVFEQTREQTLENYHKYRQRWEDSGSLDALNTAINIGSKLLESEERDNAEFVRNLRKLEGDIAWLNYLNAVTDLEKDTFLEEALEKYQEAGLKEKIAPIRYEQGNWDECLKNLTSDSLFEQWVQLRCRLELGDEIGIEVFEMREPKTSPSDWAIGLKQFIRETKVLVFRFFFETSFEQENDEIYDNRTWFKKSFILEELSSHGKANKLIIRLWDTYERYDESTARIYAESIRRSINTQSSESKIATIEAKIVKFPRIGEHLLSDLIAHRKTWLFATDGVKVPRFEGREFFPKHAYSKLKINNHVNDMDTDSEVRLGLLPFSHAFKLRQNLVENSDTTSIFDNNIRLKETLEIIEAMEPLVYHKHVDEFHNKLDLAWELLRKIGALFDYRVFDPKGRFRWLNEPGFYSAIVTSVFEMMEANKKYRQEQKPPLLLGSDAVYLPASYIFYHAKFKLGRNLSRYIESLEVLSRHFPGSMAIINPGRKALQAYLLEVVDEKSPLKDEEFNFLLASIRNVGKDFLEAKHMKSLGFTESQINRYKFEIKKHKLKWPYDVDSGRILKNKPKGFEKFIQEMIDCGLDQDVPRYRAALPIDWKVELQKFESMNTYNEFWNHLISLHSNPALSGSYEKQIKHHGLDRWIDLINSLDYPEAFDSEIEQRLEAFSAISSLSQFLPSIATEKGGIENPLFFLQYTSSPDDFIENLNLVRVVGDFNILDKVRMKRILVTNVFGPWKNEMQDKYQAITKPTPDQELNHMTTMQEIGNLEAQIGLDLVSMYEERVAFILKGKTVQELKEFAELHTPEAKTTGAKGKLIQSILTELDLENTVIGQYLSK